MAKLMNPLMSTEARGKVEGTIYNTWRGIRYAKSFTAPAQPRTSKQLQIRAYAVKVIREWAELEESQRTAWNEYAGYHPEIDWTSATKRLTGANWYLRLNTRLLLMGKSTISDPPTDSAPDPVAGLSASSNEQAITLTWTPYSGTDTTVDIWLVGPHSPGRKPPISRARHSVFAQGESATGVTLSPLTPGTYTIWARAISETSGLASPWVSATAEALPAA